MQTIPLHMLIESAASDPDEKRLTGNVTDFDMLTKVTTLKKLEDQHAGAFAFLAFHPVADGPVAEYVRSGTLSHDSGPRVLVLFTTDPNATWGRKESLVDVPGVDISPDEHPAYRMVRLLFRGKGAPPLPGVLLFNRFVGKTSAVFVGLASLEKDAVRQVLREVFELAAQASTADRSAFATELGTLLTRKGVAYVKNENLSLSEWLAEGWRDVRAKKFELLAAVSSLVP